MAVRSGAASAVAAGVLTVLVLSLLLVVLSWCLKRKKQSAFSASFVSGNEPFSPAVSSEFLSRDLDEEEQALKAKSDKERAHLYKKVSSRRGRRLPDLQN